MAHVLRPLMQRPRWHFHCCTSRSALYHFLTTPLTSNYSEIRQIPLLTTATSSSLACLPSCRTFRSRSRAFKLREGQSQLDSEDSDSESDGGSDVYTKKSRNERKREARRAVRWGMDLANFSPPQIKRILKVASLEREVFDAIMLVKRLGRDVREGKRRQFNYIGRLLREVDPELMDGLIQATKDGDQQKFQSLFGPETGIMEDDDIEAEETDHEDEIDDSGYCIDVATRWFDGLINKDIIITNEIYSLSSVEFDRQELRSLVRKVHHLQELQVGSEEEQHGAAVVGAERSLARFLRGLARQLPAD